MKFPFNFNRNTKYIITTLLLGGSFIFIHNNYSSIADYIYFLTCEQ